MRVIFYVIFVIIFITIPINAQNKRALLIGIASYPTYKIDKLGWNDIHGDNDVKLLRATLKKQGFSVNSVVNKHATAKGIRKALSNMVSNTKQGDIVYVHFSGHGQPYEDLNGDEEDGWDEAIIPYDAGARYVANVYEGNNHIVDDELNGYINQIRKRAGVKGFVYVVIDACHAGGSSRGDEYDEDEELFTRGTSVGFSEANKRYAPRIDKRPVIRVPQKEGVAGTCYIEACRSYQSNCEIKVRNQYYGPLSYYINEALKKNNLTSKTRWVDDVRKRMQQDKRLLRQNMVIETSVK